MRRIDIAPPDLEMLRAILRKHLPDREILVFGSRVTGTAKPFSDIDLAIMGEQPVPAGSLVSLRDALDWSDLPFKVDLVEWASTGGSFRKIIRRDAVPLADCRA